MKKLKEQLGDLIAGLIKAAAIRKEWERVRTEKERQRQELERKRISRNGFDQQDAAVLIFAQASGQYGARRPRTNDIVVVSIEHPQAI